MSDDSLSPAELTEILAETEGTTSDELDAAAEELEASMDVHAAGDT